MDTAAEGVSSSQLAEFVRANRGVIIQRWHEAIHDRPANQGLSKKRLIDHIPELLDAIAETGEARIEDPRARLSPEAAEQHALTRLTEGMDLSQVVVELAVLRDCILQVWDAQRAPGAARPEVRFLNRSVDRAITASIQEYIAARDRTMVALDRISAAALESRRLDDLLQQLLRVLVETTPAVDTGVVLLREGDDLVVRAAVGLEEEAGDEDRRVRIGEGFAGRIAAERRPRMHCSGKGGEVFSPILRSEKLRCLYGVPLTDDGVVVGVAHVGSATAPSFSDQDKRLFQAMAARATSGIVYHQLREALERRAAELAAVIESIPDAVFVGDADGIRMANRAGLALLGVDSPAEIEAQGEALVGRFEVRRATGEILPRESQPFARALSGEQATDELFVRNRKTEKDLVIRAAAAPVRVGTRTTGAVMVATDVTARRREEEERKLLYEQARQAVADREHALAVVSHDLRNPLNAVGLAATMLAGEVTTEVARKAVGSITRGVGRMSRLISDLLDFSSIQAGRLSLSPALIDAASVLDEAVESVRGEAESRGLELRKDATSLLVRADHDRLLQALGNLLGNAIKATAAGFVGVSVSVRDGQALFTVRDSGPGVPQDQRERIFEPYWRAKNPTYKGTGLGLAITRAIVLAHGGAIWLESHRDGGAVFNFTIPDVDTSSGAAERHADAVIR